MEIETISKITLDLYTKNIVSISAKQYDNKTRFVEITCVENGIIFQVDKLTMSAFIRFKKPDDNGVFNEVEVTSDGKLKIELTEQMLSASGRAIADVFLLRKVFTSEEKPTNIDDIYKVNAPIISIMDFYINITPTALNHSQIESSYEFNALTNALAQIDYNNKKVVELDKTLTGNENIRNNNESTRQNNEQTRINSENQRINAENIRNTSEDKRTKSENERIKQENIRNTSEQQRISSENNRIINENDRKTNENIRKSNESQRQTNETNRISSEDKRLSSETDRQSNETTRQKNESTRQTNENIRISNETDRANAEAERVKNEITRISNENTRNTQETKRQADTATAITNANNAAKNANDKANDLQNKLDNHHFVLTNELENSVSSTSTTHAPTANAVKTAYDKAVSVENTINSNKNNWNDKYTRNEIDNKFSTLESNIYWKEAVSTYTDIAKTYPNPQDGWTVNVKDTDYTYRYSGTSWIAISANAIPKATQSVDGLLSKEDKTNYDDTNSKKHTHSNKSVLDGITSALVTTWNTVTNKLDKTGDASNVTNTITTASTRVNLSTGEKLSISLGKIAKWFSDLKTVAFSGSYNDLSNKPTALPASDVSAWAKASTKPTYTKAEVGLGDVDNTADSTKSVKYATSAGSASSASKATSVVDYGNTAKTIQIGYNGNGISGDAIKFIAGYTTGNGSDVNAKIKDVSKDALKLWLGLGSLAYSSATIPTIPSSLPANGGNSTTVNGHTVNSDVPANAKFTDTNTWRPLGTTADTACAGNDSRLSNARPANGGTSTYANYVYATSHQGSWYQNSQWDGTYFQTNYKNGNNVLPMKVGYSGHADSAGSVAWSNVSGRPSSMPASDVYAWAKASTKPSYSWGEITGKPNSFTPASHTHNYAGSSSAGGAANKAIGVVDYNDSKRTIKIGYTGDSLKSSEIGFIAGYANINSSTCIKDISKDQLLAWLGLDSLITTGYNDTMWSTASGSMYYYIKFSSGIMIMVTIVPDAWASSQPVYTYPVSFINDRYALIAVDNSTTAGVTFDRRIPYIWYTKSSFQIYSNSPITDFYNEGMDDSMSVICIGRWK